ncbi:MAG: hypothetical protein RL508_1235 [Actinomycetota bacterium]|jgi:uncharacterized protein YdhG (YjbR/CyaY superfamily)
MTEKKSSGVFTAEEKAAIKQYRDEQKAQAKREKDEAGKLADLNDVLAAIEKLPQPDKHLAEQIHRIVTSVAPQLNARTWYGFPAYYLDGKLITFFQFASKFKARYGTLGFADNANLDEGNMWPVAYAVIEIDAATEKRIAELVFQAIS